MYISIFYINITTSNKNIYLIIPYSINNRFKNKVLHDYQANKPKNRSNSFPSLSISTSRTIHNHPNSTYNYNKHHYRHFKPRKLFKKRNGTQWSLQDKCFHYFPRVIIGWEEILVQSELHPFLAIHSLLSLSETSNSSHSDCLMIWSPFWNLFPIVCFAVTLYGYILVWVDRVGESEALGVIT